MAMEKEGRNKRVAPPCDHDSEFVEGGSQRRYLMKMEGHRRREFEKMIFYRAAASSYLRFLKRLFSGLRPLLPLNKPIHGKLDDSELRFTNSFIPCLHIILSYIRKSGHLVDYFKSGIEELFSLCSEYVEINSKSHEEICQLVFAKRSNTMKEIEAQFQATDRLNDLPQDLMNDIIARVLLQQVSEKIIALIDNLLYLLLPIEI
ncbi:hypothetical protein MRB53_024990 [Persea americana]|uniref:Uncharacterized protein n=1 Tax=Persea americana TaxID=3435 RepID=A0ACC2LEY3_PERAE|nr:hypothetical protein MRB53_024990 [Persea americana]|eukprot:TRINITY_DN539_c2_g2_i4.p1 TRINITY_DN539_c2_g2~~TRINITY_DN539_c2_g2_i4.p1  ORF type:complete len:204 (-),score=24.65 TRINITY_DN539_c2_g2_i4:783-1394(-)